MLEYDLISSASYQSSASVTSYLIQQLVFDFVYLERKEPYPSKIKEIFLSPLKTWKI